MNGLQINTEIENTKIIMNNLLNCAKDKSIAAPERKQYYSEYLQTSAYYYNLMKTNLITI